MYVSVLDQQISPTITLLLRAEKHSSFLRASLNAIQPFVSDKLRRPFGLITEGLHICSQGK